MKQRNRKRNLQKNRNKYSRKIWNLKFGAGGIDIRDVDYLQVLQNVQDEDLKMAELYSLNFTRPHLVLADIPQSNKMSEEDLSSKEEARRREGWL